MKILPSSPAEAPSAEAPPSEKEAVGADREGGQSGIWTKERLELRRQADGAMGLAERSGICSVGQYR
jgi:hypothetical protein